MKTMKTMKTINHITLNTGHNRVSPRSELRDTTLEVVRPWMITTLVNGEPSPLSGSLGEEGFHARFWVEAGALLCTLFAKKNNPVLTFGVAIEETQSEVLWDRMCKESGLGKGLTKPGAPLCAVALHTDISTHLTAQDWCWTGAFALYVAWAFIEFMRSPRARAFQAFLKNQNWSQGTSS